MLMRGEKKSRWVYVCIWCHHVQIPGVRIADTIIFNRECHAAIFVSLLCFIAIYDIWKQRNLYNYIICSGTFILDTSAIQCTWVFANFIWLLEVSPLQWAQDGGLPSQFPTGWKHIYLSASEILRNLAAQGLSNFTVRESKFTGEER